MANSEQLKKNRVKIGKIEVDRDLCIGAASCIAVAPNVFELDGENKAVLVQEDGTKNSGPVERNKLADKKIDDETILLAAKSCPTNAIFVYDEEGNRIYP